ncbi:hypothetical protein J437_LFUL001550 [Ladona fulva]|uniref:FHA domain-containing protein n=1 Tax=Ladona fulva TaxID=123851 RepID=A0A8K0JZR1_LADFU|nr:hypothetical protein J437_LFUL001550 [Ladona fulva]
MRDKSSSLLKSKRRRYDSGSSSEESKQNRVSSDSENNPSRNCREKIGSKYLSSKVVSRSQGSDSDREIERRSEKKRKKHDDQRRKERYSDSEDDSSRGKLREPISSEKHASRNEKYDNRIDDREKKRNKDCRHRKEQECRESSEGKLTDDNFRKERYRHDRESENSAAREGRSRHTDRREDSPEASRRLQHNDRSHDRGENGNERRKNNRQEHQREGRGGYQRREERRNRWSDGDEQSRGGPSRRERHPREGEQESRFDPSRPIKREPGVNDDENENYEWGRQSASGSNPNVKKENNEPKEKPNFGLSGKLTEDTNTFNGVVIKYNEPPEARKPRRRWRLYVFKGEENLPTLYLHRQSCFLIGRDRKVVDIPVDHPSCSKQHAAFQFRLVPYQRPDGTMGKRVRPYIIDLESANGTFVNNNQIEAKKYVELLERDVLKFGFSSREYVLLHEQSKEEEAEDDDVVGT